MVEFKGTLEVLLYLSIVIYLLILITELPKYSWNAAIFPLLVIILSLILIFLKFLQILTKMKWLDKVDKLTYVNINIQNEHAKEEVTTRHAVITFLFTLSLAVGVYLVGFFIAGGLFATLYVYYYSRNIKNVAFMTILVLTLTYLLSRVFYGEIWKGILFGGG